MKKKILAIVLCALMTLSLTACNEAASSVSIEEKPLVTESTVETGEKEEVTVAASDSAEASVETETKEEEDCELIYKALLTDCYDMVFHKMEPMYNELYSMYADVVYYTEDEIARLGYCFEDLDGNGRSELIIGYKNIINVVATYDENGKVEILLAVGYRSHLSIFENNSILVEGSSGASCYSYNFLDWEGGKLKSLDFYFTDTALDGDGLAYYHNTSAIWDVEQSEEIEEAVFNICTEVGLEVRNFEENYEYLGNYSDIMPGTIGYNWNDLLGTTWDLVYTVDKEAYHDVSDNVMQYIQFMEDGTVVYCHNDEGHDYMTTDVPTSIVENENYSIIYLNLVDELDRRITLRIAKYTNLDQLVIQREYYDYDAYDIIIVNEYYKQTMG